MGLTEQAPEAKPERKSLRKIPCIGGMTFASSS
jgi:hypothetical protein